jgi:DNA polymerase-3 subunit delta
MAIFICTFYHNFEFELDDSGNQCHDKIQNMFYILYGEDDFSIYQALGEIKEGLGDAGTLAVNTVSLDGEHLTLNELRHNCNTVPFLAPYRLVVVKGLLKRFEPRKGELRSGGRAVTKTDDKLQEWKDLASYIKQMAPTTALVLIDGKLSKQNPLLKELSPLAELRICPLLRRGKLTTWIQQWVTKKNGAITSEATDLLAQLIGGNLWAMSNEIDKLLLYAQGRNIEENDVRQLVSYAQEANIFALVDAVLEGQPKIAHRILHRLYQEGASSVYILVMITRQFRLIVQTKELSSRLSPSQIQAKLGLKSYALDKTLDQAKSYDFERIRQAYGRLLKADVDIKTGRYNDRIALELLIAELCRSKRTHSNNVVERY